MCRLTELPTGGRAALKLMRGTYPCEAARNEDYK
jgi:hypothetical protein